MKGRHVESIISLLSFSPGFSSPVRALKRRLGLCWLCPDRCEQAVIHNFSKALVIVGRHLFRFLYSILLESCLFYPSNHLSSTLSTSTTSLIRLYDIQSQKAAPPSGFTSFWAAPAAPKEGVTPVEHFWRKHLRGSTAKRYFWCKQLTDLSRLFDPKFHPISWSKKPKVL